MGFWAKIFGREEKKESSAFYESPDAVKVRAPEASPPVARPLEARAPRESPAPHHEGRTRAELDAGYAKMHAVRHRERVRLLDVLRTRAERQALLEVMGRRG